MSRGPCGSTRAGPRLPSTTLFRSKAVGKLPAATHIGFQFGAECRRARVHAVIDIGDATVVLAVEAEIGAEERAVRGVVLGIESGQAAEAGIAIGSVGEHRHWQDADRAVVEMLEVETDVAIVELAGDRKSKRLKSSH